MRHDPPIVRGRVRTSHEVKKSLPHRRERHGGWAGAVNPTSTIQAVACGLLDIHVSATRGPCEGQAFIPDSQTPLLKAVRNPWTPQARFPPGGRPGPARSPRPRRVRRRRDTRRDVRRGVRQNRVWKDERRHGRSFEALASAQQDTALRHSGGWAARPFFEGPREAMSIQACAMTNHATVTALGVRVGRRGRPSRLRDSPAAAISMPPSCAPADGRPAGALRNSGIALTVIAVSGPRLDMFAKEFSRRFKVEFARTASRLAANSLCCKPCWSVHESRRPFRPGAVNSTAEQVPSGRTTSKVFSRAEDVGGVVPTFLLRSCARLARVAPAKM
jgi:hypothetical protein